MIDLMLKLLTYEPYEKVSGNEKEYIDKVLCGDIASDTVVTNKEYRVNKNVYNKIRTAKIEFYSSSPDYWTAIMR